jgi:peptidoglycan/LPS O-acetylase OafA/YrhL
MKQATKPAVVSAPMSRARRARGASPAAGRRVGSLDGIRGLALVAVLIYHADASWLPGGFLGVEMFFVLSGFLLTSLLLDEHRRTGAIDHVAYALRRVKRIVPGLFMLLTVLAVVGFFLADEDAHRLGRDLVSSVFGLTNWHLIRDGSSYFGQTGRPPLVRHLWSIAVEVQAYLVVPFVASFIAKRSRQIAIATLGSGVAVSAILLGVLARTSSTTRAYFGTDTRIGAILAGALIAVVLTQQRGPVKLRLSGRALAIMTCAGAAALAFLFVVTNDRSGFLYPAGFLIAQGATALLLVAASRSLEAAQVLSYPPLRWLGTRSYGIYLWHWPVVALVRPGVDVDWSPIFTALFTIAVGIALGALSYRFVEQPFINARRSPWPAPQIRAGALAWACGMVATITLLVQTAPVDPIAASLAAGERALAEQEEQFADTAPATARPRGYGDDPPPGYGDDPPVAGAAPQAAPLAVARRFAVKEGPPKNTVKVTAMGDSVMLGAAPDLKERFGKSSYVNAEKNRQWRQGVQAIRVFKKQGKLGRVLIAHLGNNGGAKPEHIEAILKEIKGISHHLVLATVRVTKPWQDQVNDVIKKAAKKHPKSIVIANWYRMSEGHRDWFYSDGTHLTRKGAEEYTKLLAGSVPPDPTPKPKPKPTPKPSPTPEGLLGKIKP